MPSDKYNKFLCREGSPRLLKDKIHHPTTPSGLFSSTLPILVRDWLLVKNGTWAIFPIPIFPKSQSRTEMGKVQENIPEGVVGWWVLSLSNLGLPSPQGDLL